jgi:hypothetical protein
MARFLLSEDGEGMSYGFGFRFGLGGVG